MFLDQNRHEYPNVTRLLKRMTALQNNKRVWNAFLKWSGASEDLAIITLTYRTLPYINVGDCKIGDSSRNSQVRGHSARFISIDQQILMNYEERKTQEAEKSLERTLLLEAIHFTRNLLDLPDNSDQAVWDIKQAFDVEAYGPQTVGEG